MTIYAFEGTSPLLDPSAWVAPGAHVMGRVEISVDASIWFGATLRGDNDLIRIGAGTNIQENAVLHTDTGLHLLIGQGCVIGHGAIVHGCIIGDNVLIGMGAIVMNGARIGDNAIIGAGSLVTEGTEIAPYSLALGSPARVVRQVSPEQAARTASAAHFYIEKARRFRQGLMEILPDSQGS